MNYKVGDRVWGVWDTYEAEPCEGWVTVVEVREGYVVLRDESGVQLLCPPEALDEKVMA